MSRQIKQISVHAALMASAVAKPNTLQAAFAAGAAAALTPLRTQEVAHVALETIRDALLAPATTQALHRFFESAGTLCELERGESRVPTATGELTVWAGTRNDAGLTPVGIGLADLYTNTCNSTLPADFDAYRLAVRDLESQLLSMNDDEQTRVALVAALVFSRKRHESQEYRSALNALIANDHALATLGCTGVTNTPADHAVRLRFDVPELGSASSGGACTADHPWTRKVAAGAAEVHATARAFGVDLAEYVSAAPMQKVLRDATHRLASDVRHDVNERRSIATPTPDGTVKLCYWPRNGNAFVAIQFDALTKAGKTPPDAVRAARSLEPTLSVSERARRRYAALAGIGESFHPGLIASVNAGLATTAIHQLIPEVSFNGVGLTFPVPPI